MAFGTRNPAFHNGIERTNLRFTIFPQGVSATPYTEAAGTLVGTGGWVTSARRLGPGSYTCTLASSARRAFASVQLSSSVVADAFCRVVSITNEGNPALPIVLQWDLLVGGVLADLAAGAQERFMLDIDLELV